MSGLSPCIFRIYGIHMCRNNLTWWAYCRNVKSNKSQYHKKWILEYLITQPGFYFQTPKSPSLASMLTVSTWCRKVKFQKKNPKILLQWSQFPRKFSTILVFKVCHFWMRVMLEIFVKRKMLYIEENFTHTTTPHHGVHIRACSILLKIHRTCKNCVHTGFV